MKKFTRTMFAGFLLTAIMSTGRQHLEMGFSDPCVLVRRQL